MNFVIAASNLPSESSCDSGKADFEGPLGPFGGQRQGFSYVKGFVSEVLRIWRDSNPMLFTSRRCDEGFEDVLKWQRHQNGAKMVLKWSQNGPGMVPKCITDWSNHKTYMDLKIRMSFGSFFLVFAWLFWYAFCLEFGCIERDIVSKSCIGHSNRSHNFPRKNHTKIKFSAIACFEFEDACR